MHKKYIELAGQAQILLCQARDNWGCDHHVTVFVEFEATAHLLPGAHRTLAQQIYVYTKDISR